MLNRAFVLLQEHAPPDIHEAAADCVSALAEQLEYQECNNVELEMSIYNAVKSLEITYQQSVQAEDLCKVSFFINFL